MTFETSRAPQSHPRSVWFLSRTEIYHVSLDCPAIRESRRDPHRGPGGEFIRGLYEIAPGEEDVFVWVEFVDPDNPDMGASWQRLPSDVPAVLGDGYLTMLRARPTLDLLRPCLVCGKARGDDAMPPLAARD